MIEGLSIRQATADDLDFVIETIIESEKSNSSIISSCNVFALSEVRFKEILKIVLLQNIPNYDYYLSGFLIAEKDGEYIGALGSWFEAPDETPSGIIKATVLFPYLDKSKMKDISKNTKVIKDLSLNRKSKTLQLEHGYTREPYRRQGVFTNIIREHILWNKVEYNFEKVQGILFKENYKSFNAHLKLGYQVVEEKHTANLDILKFFPYGTKVLMELDKEKFENLSKLENKKSNLWRKNGESKKTNQSIFGSSRNTL
ncbi:MAG: hypothetical protein M1480_11340 [Bacteroidetes bacterium]|nr:hypothetical protein [Bacteroidota bacterium]